MKRPGASLFWVFQMLVDPNFSKNWQRYRSLYTPFPAGFPILLLFSQKDLALQISHSVLGLADWEELGSETQAADGLSAAPDLTKAYVCIYVCKQMMMYRHGKHTT